MCSIKQFARFSPIECVSFENRNVRVDLKISQDRSLIVMTPIVAKQGDFHYNEKLQATNFDREDEEPGAAKFIAQRVFVQLNGARGTEKELEPLVTVVRLMMGR